MTECNPSRQVCHLCGEALKCQLENVPDPDSGEIFSVFHCKQCRLGHTVPQPEQLSQYYGAGYYGSRHGITQAWCLFRRRRFVEAMVGNHSRGKLLDVGCGDGSFMQAFRERGWTVTGVEMDDTEMAPAVYGSISEATAHGPFDCITAWHSFEHFCSPRDTLAEMYRCLRPGGVILIAVPDAGGVQARLFGRNWLHRDVPRHLYHFEAVSLKQVLSANSLELIRCWHMEFEYDLLGYVQSMLNRLSTRKNVFFRVLTGKPTACPVPVRLGHAIAGFLLLILMAPLPLLDAYRGLGGSLIMAAKKPEISR